MTMTSRAFDFGHDEDCTPMHGYAATREVAANDGIREKLAAGMSATGATS